VAAKQSLFWTACLLALLLLASGCGSSPTPEASSGAAASVESPLADLLGIPLGPGDDSQEFFDDMSRQAEIKTAECMIEQGFQYTAVDNSALTGVDIADFESREFVEKYGFGIASNPFDQLVESVVLPQDPNGEYVQSLSDGEREAYQIALTGELPDFDSAESTVFEPSGCQGDAFDEVFAVFSVFEEFAPQLSEFEEAFDADPRILAANANWGSCMAEAGYRYADSNGAQADIQRKFDTITADPDAYLSDAEIMVQAEEVLGDESTSFLRSAGQLRPEFQAQVDVLADEERAIALASWECSADVREISATVQQELEQAFVDKHGAAISASLEG